MKKSGTSQGQSAPELISKRIAELGDWRGKTLSTVRALIKDADPDVVEEWKWVKPTNPGTPVWSHDGIICTGESYKSVVKLTFAKGASLKDPARLFNASLDGNVRRAIDIREGEDRGAWRDRCLSADPTGTARDLCNRDSGRRATWTLATLEGSALRRHPRERLDRRGAHVEMYSADIGAARPASRSAGRDHHPRRSRPNPPSWRRL
jgi:hypothetical protein